MYIHDSFPKFDNDFYSLNWAFEWEILKRNLWEETSEWSSEEFSEWECGESEDIKKIIFFLIDCWWKTLGKGSRKKISGEEKSQSEKSLEIKREKRNRFKKSNRLLKGKGDKKGLMRSRDANWPGRAGLNFLGPRAELAEKEPKSSPERYKVYKVYM